MPQLNSSIARIQLNSPKTLNALTLSMGQHVQTLLHQYQNDPQTHAVILESQVPKSFSVGIDLHEFQSNPTPSYRQNFLDTWSSVANFTKPIIVKLHGYVFGGGLELALMGDILITDDTATFGQPELTVGTIPGLGATQRLVRSIGEYRTNDIILTGRRIDANTALEWGLVSQCVSSTLIDTTVTTIANTLATRSLPILIAAKAAIKSAHEHALSSGLQTERQHFLNTFTLIDQHEGFQAFIDKRSPSFKNQ